MPKTRPVRDLKLRNSSYYLWSLPKHFVEALQWKEGDDIEISITPDAKMFLSNKERPAPSFMEIALSLGESEFQENQKAYKRALARNMSPDAREVKARVDWDEVSSIENPDEDYIRYLEGHVEMLEERLEHARTHLEIAKSNFKKQEGGAKQ